METSKNEVYFDILSGEQVLNMADGGVAFALRINEFKDLTMEEEARFVNWTVYSFQDVYNPVTNQREQTKTYKKMVV